MKLRPSIFASPSPIIIWLYVLSGLVIIMIVVGGITRLTESGLSITAWEPISGIIPPLSESAWLHAFAQYQTTSEYQQIHFWMNLDDFKRIYCWEWLHRFLGRMIGLALIVPFFIFLATGRLRRDLIPPLLLIFALGMVQAVLGWLMVKSGLINDATDVSPLKLMLHLVTAFVLLGLLLLMIGRESRKIPMSPRRLIMTPQGRGGALILILCVIQIGAGALVAGHNAGLIYNQWPYMGASFIPVDYQTSSGLASLIFDHPVAAQFHHRLIAYTLIVVAAWHYLTTRQLATNKSALALLVAIAAQAILGIVTLLAVTPLHLAILHQLAAVAIFIIAMLHIITIATPQHSLP